MARVTDNGAVSGAFAVTSGVKQGRVFVPTLFSLMFSALLMDAYRDERSGIRIAYRTDDHLLNHQHIHFQSRVSTTTVHELRFVEECAVNATSMGTCKGKTVVLHQPPTDVAHVSHQIIVNGAQLKVVENFTCLGSSISHATKTDGEIVRQISKASQTFDRLQSTV
nr:unnamed protein product [Spirometra erinaceieuropaei]